MYNIFFYILTEIKLMIARIILLKIPN